MRHLNAGETLQNERYTINGVLGVGGFGITYLATETSTEKIIAIKSLNAAIQGKPNFLELQNKFIKEAFLLTKCSHPNVVQVHNVFDEAGLWYIVTDYIQGDDLSVYLQRNGVFNEVDAIQIIEQVGEALSYIHEQGFLHRDVKPHNILLSGNVAKLIDFGIAREFTAGETRTHTNYRTDGYAPPEQYEERAKRDVYTDVYALAATLYNLLTNQIPIPAQFRSYVALPPPKQFNNIISDRTNNAIFKGMELQPENRPQTVQEFLDLLLLKPQSQKDNFPLNIDIDYPRYRILRDSLKAKNWQRADEETAISIFEITDRVFDGWFRKTDIENFPCTDLNIINELWLYYSKGKFGFSVQKKIYRQSSLKHFDQYEQQIGYLDKIKNDDAEELKNELEHIQELKKEYYQEIERVFLEKYNEDIMDSFGEVVGWKKRNQWLNYHDITSASSIVSGTFPICVYLFICCPNNEGDVIDRNFYTGDLFNSQLENIFSRLEDCNKS